MPHNDTWEWHKLLYVGTVILRRTEAQFWRMTPRKLNALTQAHIALNSTENSGTTKHAGARAGFIDQIF